MDVVPFSYPVDVVPFSYTMDIVLKKINYNTEVFSKIVEDFQEFVYLTKPGTFQERLNKISISFPEANLVCQRMTTDKLEEGLKVLKKEPKIYFEDFDKIETILEGAHPEEEFDKWFGKLPCHLYIFYDTVMGILRSRNCQYALRRALSTTCSSFV